MWVYAILFLQLCIQQRPLHPHLEADPSLQHSVSEPAAWPQQRESVPESRLTTRRVRTDLEVEVTVICANEESESFKMLQWCPVDHFPMINYIFPRWYIFLQLLHIFNLTLSSSSSSVSSPLTGVWGDFALVGKKKMHTVFKIYDKWSEFSGDFWNPCTQKTRIHLL